LEDQPAEQPLPGGINVALSAKTLILVSALCAAMAIVLFNVSGAGVASANQCAAQCFAAEKACMRATKGSPECSAQLTSCLQSCRGAR
jgi:hypothetical protein